MKSFDPRAKLTMVFAITSLAIFVQDLRLFLLLVAISGVASTALGGNWQVLWRLRRLALLIVGLVFLQSIFGAGGRVWLQLGSVDLLTSGGLTMGAALAMRFIVIVWVSSILLGESSRRLIQGLIQWRVPYEIAFMVHLAIRFLPLLQEELQDALAAIQLRGIELNKLKLCQKIQVFSYLFLPVLAGVIHKSRELSTAMEMKAFRAVAQRTSHFTLTLQGHDYALMIGSFLVWALFAVLVTGAA